MTENKFQDKKVQKGFDKKNSRLKINVEESNQNLNFLSKFCCKVSIVYVACYQLIYSHLAKPKSGSIYMSPVLQYFILVLSWWCLAVLD